MSSQGSVCTQSHLSSHLDEAPVPYLCSFSLLLHLHLSPSGTIRLQHSDDAKIHQHPHHHRRFWLSCCLVVVALRHIPPFPLSLLLLSLSTKVSSLFLRRRSRPHGAPSPFCNSFTGSALSWLLEIRWKQWWKPWAIARSAAVCPLVFCKLLGKKKEKRML